MSTYRPKMKYYKLFAISSLLFCATIVKAQDETEGDFGVTQTDGTTTTMHVTQAFTGNTARSSVTTQAGFGMQMTWTRTPSGADMTLTGTGINATIHSDV